MLNFLNHFSVPGVEHVMVYHDDQNTELFYMVPELPSILRRENDTPSFNLISFARDFSLLANEAAELPTAETEGGLLQLTTSLEVSAEDQAKIRNYIAGGMSGALRPLFRGRALTFARHAPSRNIKLTYPTWVDGAVHFYLFPSGGDTFVKALQGSEKPSLVSSNLASYTALLGQEGLRLIRNSIEDGWSPGTINYDVSFVARIPNLTVTVKGNSTRRVRGDQGALDDHRDLSQRQPHVDVPISAGLEPRRDPRHVHRAAHRVRQGRLPQRREEQGIRRQRSRPSSSTIVQQLITTSLPRRPDSPPASRPRSSAPTRSPTGPGRRWPAATSCGSRTSTRRWTSRSTSRSPARPISRSSKHPNSELFALVDPEQVKKSIIEADLSQPYFTLLDVPVQVTADFDRDPIAAIKVFLDYDQKDDQSGTHKTPDRGVPVRLQRGSLLLPHGDGAQPRRHAQGRVHLPQPDHLQGERQVRGPAAQSRPATATSSSATTS